MSDSELLAELQMSPEDVARLRQLGSPPPKESTAVAIRDAAIEMPEVLSELLQPGMIEMFGRECRRLHTARQGEALAILLQGIVDLAAISGVRTVELERLAEDLLSTIDS